MSPRTLLGPPALLSTEDEERYRRIVLAFIKTFGEIDPLLLVLIRDVADACVEVERWRRIKAKSIDGTFLKAVAQQISDRESAARHKIGRLEDDADKARQALTSRQAAADIAQARKDIDEKLAADIAEVKSSLERDLQVLRHKEATDADYAAEFYHWEKEVQTVDGLQETAEKNSKRRWKTWSVITKDLDSICAR